MPWRTALHSVSYAGLWGQASLSTSAFLERASRLGYDSVMLMAKRPHVAPLDVDADERRRLREQLERLRLGVACLAGYNDFGLRGDAVGTPFDELQLLYVRELCRLARDLGCPLVRLFTGFVPAGVSPDEAWRRCVLALRESSRIAAGFGVTIGVQNHHDVACHFESLRDLIEDVGEPNCRLMFDAWTVALHGDDVIAAAAELAPLTVHTTIADYVQRPQYRYAAELVNYLPGPAAVRAVPMGEGFIDYRGFLQALQAGGYTGAVAYEMCSPLRGGGSEANLDRYARRFLEYMHDV